MSLTIISTKLYIPPIRKDYVPRPRLIKRLDEGLTCKLALVSAPAGFGKTMILSEWVAQCDRPVAWISLDRADNAPARFLMYLTAALQTIDQSIGKKILDSLESQIDVVVESTVLIGLLTELINQIAAAQTLMVLVLDDFHKITDGQVQDAVTFLIDNSPQNIHLIICGRVDPPWPMARLRARGDMIELRTRDLRFNHEEAASFLNEVMGLGLSRDDIANLDERTEGWIAGLQMAALSMQGREDISGFIKAFAGSHRFILDFLIEEVLDRQPDEIQAFLYSTSLLERLTAPLCDALTGKDDGQQILDYLEQNNLFLIPLDDERTWYRYHRLFADLLKERLAHTDAGRISRLHLSASAWYESHGLYAEAVEHALSAHDFDRAAKLVAGNAISLIDHGEKQSLGDWLETLPDDMIQSEPWLSVANAWRHVYTGRLEAVDPLLQDAEIRLAAVYAQDERQQISGHIAAIRVYEAELRGELDEAIVLARESLELLPEHDLSARCFAATRLGAALRLRGNLGEAEDALEDAYEISQTIGDSHVSVNVLCELAGLYLWQGYFRKAETVCQQALRLAEQHFRRSGRRLPVVGHAFSRLGYIYYEWNDLEAAVKCALEGIQHSERGGLTEILADNTIYLAMALQAKGDESGAIEAMANARRIGVTLSPWYIEVLEPYEAHIRLVQGDFEMARRLVDERDFIRQGEFGIEYFLNKNMQSRVLIIQDPPTSERLDEAEAVLAELLENAERIGSQLFVIKTLALQAMLYQARGDQVKAVNHLERALAFAEPEGFVRSFIDLGGSMGELLLAVLERGFAGRYAQKLLEEMSDSVPGAALQAGASRVPKPIPGLFEELTEREIQVLRLLNTELSIPEIAGELIIGVSTVRSHVKNIYAKLGVHSRYEAIAKAKELDLF